MSYLKQIILTQFRNYSIKKINFEAPVIAIVGNNGVGKTNLLDAIYYLCFTKSYFHNKELLNVQNGKSGFRIEGIMEKDQTLKNIVCIWSDGKKKMSVDQLEYEKLADHIGQYTALMIAPDDLKIINEGSDQRRKFIDGIICQVNADYLKALLNYQKILLRKNAYLKSIFPGSFDRQLMSIYNNQLKEYGTLIIKERAILTNILAPIIQKFYRQISHNNESVQLIYSPNISDDNYILNLNQILNQEIEAGRSLKGPHLDDWQLLLNQMPFKTQSSQGQKKSMLIALKLAQLEFLKDNGKNSILLLDDIFEKLDKTRIHLFFNLVKEMRINQIFLTNTDKNDTLDTIKPYFDKVQTVEL